MKKLLVIAGAIFSLNVQAAVVFYAPTHYICSQQGEHCSCTQSENIYFQTTFNLPHECKSQGVMNFILQEEDTVEPRNVFAVYNYNSYSLTAETIVYSHADISSNSWQWTPTNYYCAVNNNPTNCPIILNNS